MASVDSLEIKHVSPKPVLYALRAPLPQPCIAGHAAQHRQPTASINQCSSSCVLQTVLRTLEGGLASLHVPYSNGWSIIALTALVKLATFPFTKIQARTTARESVPSNLQNSQSIAAIGRSSRSSSCSCCYRGNESSLEVQNLDLIKRWYGADDACA